MLNIFWSRSFWAFTSQNFEKGYSKKIPAIFVRFSFFHLLSREKRLLSSWTRGNHGPWILRPGIGTRSPLGQRCWECKEPSPKGHFNLVRKSQNWPPFKYYLLCNASLNFWAISNISFFFIRIKLLKSRSERKCFFISDFYAVKKCFDWSNAEWFIY